MRAGEYIGADGRTYRWDKAASGYHQQVQVSGVWHPQWHIEFVDWPAAKAALDALIESEEGEWVGFQCAPGRFLRAKRDGEDVQEQVYDDLGRGRWQSLPWHDVAVRAYRKGRSVALEQVQELVGAIEEARLLHYERYMTGPRSYPYAEDWDRIRDLAKRVDTLTPAE